MLSRVADSIFWLARYLERAENYARFMDVNFNLTLDLPPGVQEQWQPLIDATGDREEYLSRYDNFSRENAIYFLAFDRENANSILSSIRYSRENARIIRENIAREIWENINELYYYVNNSLKDKIWEKENPQEFFQSIKYKIQLIYGIAFTATPRTDGWYFTQMGQLIERADKTSRILDVKYHILLPSVKEVGSPLDYLHWAALLKSVSAYNAFRRYYGKIEPINTVEYLVLNRYFPRSIFYCLNGTEQALHKIRSKIGDGYNKAERALGNLRSDLEYADIKEIMDYGLHEYLDKLQQKLNQISYAIYDQYFEIQPNFAGQTQDQ